MWFGGGADGARSGRQREGKRADSAVAGRLRIPGIAASSTRREGEKVREWQTASKEQEIGESRGG